MIFLVWQTVFVLRQKINFDAAKCILNLTVFSPVSESTPFPLTFDKKNKVSPVTVTLIARWLWLTRLNYVSTRSLHLPPESQELAVLQQCSHPFIVSLSPGGHFQTSRHLHLVLNYCPGGDLSSLLGRQGKLAEPQVRWAMWWSTFPQDCLLFTVQKESGVGKAKRIAKKKVIYLYQILDISGVPVVPHIQAPHTRITLQLL